MKIDLLLDRLTSIKVSKLDDSTDRLCYFYTTIGLLFFCLLIGMQQTFKGPITCKPDANFPEAWTTYVDNYCYITGTYHTHNGSDYDSTQPKYDLSYYQWVPYTLLIQALTFAVPHFLYLALSGMFLPGLNFKRIVDRCEKAAELETMKMEKETGEIAYDIYEHTKLPGRRPKKLGSSFVLCYMFMKVLHFFVILSNIHFLNQFVGLGSYDWAFEVARNAYSFNYWENTGFFPRVSFCDVPFKMLGQSNVKTIQCLLMVNILAEKVYVLIYFWFLALAAISVINFFYVVYCLFVDSSSYLHQLADTYYIEGKAGKDKFVDGYMSKDGLLLIRFVKEHAGSRVAARLTNWLAGFWESQEVTQQTLFGSQW